MEMPTIEPVTLAGCSTLIKGPRLRIACIGLGRRGRKHLGVLQSCSKVEVVGAVDLDWSAFTTEHNFFVGRDAEHLLSSIDVDAVVIAVPHDQYIPVVAACSARGVHALAEKPIGRNLREVEKIVELAELGNIVVGVAVQRRQTHFYRTLEEGISRFGPPRTFWYHYALGLADVATAWRASMEAAGGGATIDMGYHVIDVLTGLLGSPNKLSCIEHRDMPYLNTAEHGASLLMQFSASTTGTVCFDWHQTHEDEHASFWWRDHGICLRDGAVYRLSRGQEELLFPREDSAAILHRQLHEFIHALNGTTSRCCRLDSTRETHQLIERCRAEHLHA